MTGPLTRCDGPRCARWLPSWLLATVEDQRGPRRYCPDCVGSWWARLPRVRDEMARVEGRVAPTERR